MKNIWIILVGVLALAYSTSASTAAPCTLKPFTVSGMSSLPTNAASYTFNLQNLANYNVQPVAGTSWQFQIDSSLTAPTLQVIVNNTMRTISFQIIGGGDAIRTGASPSLAPSFTILMSGLMLVFGTNKKYLLFLGLFLCFAASVMAVDACGAIVITYPVPVITTPSPNNGHNATNAPTNGATTQPTQRPTMAPTQSGTTNAPTQSGTTQAPTPAPTKASTSAPNPTPSGGACSLSDILTEALYNQMFPNLNYGSSHGDAGQYAIFNYQYLLAAAEQYFPAFGCTGTLAERQREIAAFLAQTSQETSGWWAGQPYDWGYCFSSEMGCNSGQCTQYCDSSNTQYPCAAGQTYYGRGPIQLSWNYNYGQFSQFYYGDSSVLLQNPNKMFDNDGIAFASALWFWMTPQNPKPSCHDVMVGNWVPTAQDTAANRLPGFGMVTFIINGGIECGVTPTPQQVTNRVGYFAAYTSILGIDEGSNVYCNNMQQY